MAYRLLYHPAVLKDDMGKIPSGEKEKIRKSIENRLQQNPVSLGKLLQQSLKGHRKFRVGGWGIIYRIDRKDIIILKIGHRREVYQQALRRTKI